jgi:hypothetical protein
MKYQNIFVYSIIAIGLLSIPSLIDSIYAQTNATNQTGGQQGNQTGGQQGNQTGGQQGNQTGGQQGNQTLGQDAQALSTVDIPELKENLMTAKEALAEGNTEEALTEITEVENQLLMLQNQPSFASNIQQIKDAISAANLNQALDSIGQVQTDVLKAETDIMKAKAPPAQLINAQGNGPDGDGGDEGDDDDGGDE